MMMKMTLMVMVMVNHVTPFPDTYLDIKYDLEHAQPTFLVKIEKNKFMIIIINVCKKVKFG